MSSQLSWQNLLLLQSVKTSATYLKIMSDIWGLHIQSIVEIGVYRGKTSQFFRTLFPDAMLYLIDPWALYSDYLSEGAGPISKKSDDYKNAYKEVKKIFKGDQQVKIIRKTSMKALEDVPDQIDLVYIDGNHSYSYVKQDIEKWFPKLRIGGLLSGHDYNPTMFPSVIKAVDEIFPEDLFIGYDHTWLKQKTKKDSSLSTLPRTICT